MGGKLFVPFADVFQFGDSEPWAKGIKVRFPAPILHLAKEKI
jgi:hypothetical protein